MFYIIFGLVWTAFSGLMMAMLCFTENNTTTEAGDMFGAKIFLGVFVLIGLGVTSIGVVKVVRDMMTKIKGTETMGVVIGIKESGSVVNGRPELKAVVMVLMENGCFDRFEEIIGFDYNKYRLGDYISVKQYNKDINILGKVDETIISYGVLEKLEQVRKEHIGHGGMNYNQVGGYVENDTSGVYDEFYAVENNKDDVKRIDDNTVIIDGVVYTKTGK